MIISHPSNVFDINKYKVRKILERMERIQDGDEEEKEEEQWQRQGGQQQEKQKYSLGTTDSYIGDVKTIITTTSAIGAIISNNNNQKNKKSKKENGEGVDETEVEEDSPTILLSIGSYRVIKKDDRLVLKVRDRKKWHDLSYIRDWRKDILERYFKLNKSYSSMFATENLPAYSIDNGVDWDKIVKILVTFEAVNSAMDYRDAINLLDTLNRMEYGEIHFWASKFLNDKVKARRAFRILYSRRCV
ncbi:MAG: hypothetical protein QXQ68_08820 [Candidatus Nitrosocaldaceae archaeon]